MAAGARRSPVHASLLEQPMLGGVESRVAIVNATLAAALALGMVAKSVTAPIAMGVAEQIQASPTLTAVFAVSTGILGAMLGRFVLNATRVKPWWQRGFALGVASHGIGTSRAFSIHPQAGAYASLGMGLHGVLGAVLIPMLMAWV